MTGYLNDRKLGEQFIYEPIKSLSRKISSYFSFQFSISVTETHLSVIKTF